MCVHRTPRCKVLYVISEILCVKYALLCVFGNTGIMMILAYIIDIDKMLKLTKGQGHKVKGQGHIYV